MQAIKIPIHIQNRSLKPNTPVYVGQGADQIKTYTTSLPYEHQCGGWVVEVKHTELPVDLDYVMEVRKKKINRKWSQIPENAQENLGAFKILNRWWRLTPWRKVKGTIGEIYSVRWVRYYKCKEEIYPACVIGIIGRGGAQPFHFEACDIRGDVLADGRCNTLETAALSCQEAIRKEILPK